MAKQTSAAADLLGEADALNLRAIDLYQRGDFAEAERLIRLSLDIREEALGPDHPEVATSLNNLAELQASLARFLEAETLCKRALSIRERVLGPAHPDVAASINNLGGLYFRQSRYEEAEPFFQRSLTLREALLGADHPAS